MSTTIYRHANVDKLSIGAVVTDRRRVTGIHLNPDRWLIQLPDGTIATCNTVVFTLPVTLCTATKEHPR